MHDKPTQNEINIIRNIFAQTSQYLSKSSKPKQEEHIVSSNVENILKEEKTESLEPQVNQSVLAYCKFISETLGVNLDAYGRDKKGKKRARRFLERQESHPHTSSSGDSSSVEDQPNESPKERVADPEKFMKTAVADLMQNNPKMTHGQAQQQALGMLKKHMGQ